MSTLKSHFAKYGALWPVDINPLTLELGCIRKGGKWKNKAGETCGLGLFEHFMNARKLLWPDRYRHRWTDLIYKEIINNQVTVLMGAASTQKTSHACEYVLIDYWANPSNTLVLLSTTTREKLNLAVFGEIKKLFNAGKEEYPFLDGHLLDSKYCITTDDLEAGEIRDLRKGIIGRPCYVGSKYVGLGAQAGIKQERIRFLADELQFMQPTFLDCLPNMFSNPDVKVIGSGNPKHDESDQLSMAACPKGGWDSIGKVEKTTCWDTKFENGRCVNLVGTDSPNFDVSENETPPFPRLVDRKFARRVAAFWGKDSLQYSTQIRGVMQIGMVGNRVVTAQLCQQHGACDLAFWSGTARTKIYAIDLAYGGRFADRCVAGPAEFGEDVNGIQALCMTDPKVVPILTTGGIPEDQIARWVQADCEKRGVEPENIFYDSTGRGTMGSAFARIFGMRTPVPIEFGGKASPRPVRHDLFVNESEGRKRLKRCDEHYSKFVSELWFSVRYVIECGQMRDLPEEVVQELCMREYGMVSGGRIEVETKDDTKERMGCSPDKGDWAAIIVEGARQRGFKIQKIGITKESESAPDWFVEDAEKYQDLIKSRLLVHS